MKKMLIALVGLLSLFSFIACNMNDNGNENGTEKEKITKKAELTGTNWDYVSGDADYVYADNFDLAIKENEIVGNGIRITYLSTFNEVDFYNEDILLESEVPENSKLKSYFNNESNQSLYFVPESDDDYYRQKDDNWDEDAWYGRKYIYKIEWNKKEKDFFTDGDELYLYCQIAYNPEYRSENDEYYTYTYTFSSYQDGYGPQNNDSSEDKNDDNSTVDASTYIGSYAFNNATGSQQNGTVTLKDGNWSYSGDKSNPAASSGTYTVNGSKVTLSWTAAGIDISESFTISTSDSSSTWTSDESGASTFFSMLFGVVATEMTFTYSE